MSVSKTDRYGLPGHEVIGCHRTVGYIFIPHCTHADVRLHVMVLEIIGCTNLTMKGFPNECI